MFFMAMRPVEYERIVYTYFISVLPRRLINLINNDFDLGTAVSEADTREIIIDVSTRDLNDAVLICSVCNLILYIII